MECATKHDDKQYPSAFISGKGAFEGYSPKRNRLRIRNLKISS